jgi:hypothetical protein
MTPSKGRGGSDVLSRDENIDPQQQWGASSGGFSLVPHGSPSFLTSIPSTPQNGQYAPQYGHYNNNAYHNNTTGNNFVNCDSYSGQASQGLDDSVDRGWGTSLPFDLGWEAGDGECSVNTSITAKNGVRNSPPGGRSAAQRWHPYTRSPPKASPDFNSKVMAICSQSFGGQSSIGNGCGAYSLF